MLFFLLLACAGSPESDAKLYTRVATMQPMRAEAALALCARIQEPVSAADCAMVAASRGAEDEGLPPDTYCERVPDGQWRWECYFHASDSLREAGDSLAAAKLCPKTGPFAQDCGQHLWQDEIRGLIYAKGPGGFAEQLPKAENVWRRWRAILGEKGDLTDRMWRRYYSNGFEARPNLDLSYCDAVEGLGATVQDHRERCRHAGAHLFFRRLRQMIMHPGARKQLCAVETPSCAAVAEIRPLQCEEDPLLTQVLAEQLDWVCVQGRDDPPPELGTIKYRNAAPEGGPAGPDGAGVEVRRPPPGPE